MGVVTRGPATGEHTTGGDYLAFVRGPLATIAARANVELPDAIQVADVEPLPAFVVHDRWVVDCPDCGRNRSMVWLSALVYLCPVCWNGAVGGDWRPVTFPAERAEIERILSARRLAPNRNWLPKETIADLRAENEAHGEGID